MIDLRWNLHPFWNKETGKNTPMTAASTGARLAKTIGNRVAPTPPALPHSRLGGQLDPDHAALSDMASIVQEMSRQVPRPYHCLWSITHMPPLQKAIPKHVFALGTALHG